MDLLGDCAPASPLCLRRIWTNEFCCSVSSCESVFKQRFLVSFAWRKRLVNSTIVGLNTFHSYSSSAFAGFIFTSLFTKRLKNRCFAPQAYPYKNLIPVYSSIAVYWYAISGSAIHSSNHYVHPEHVLRGYVICSHGLVYTSLSSAFRKHS